MVKSELVKRSPLRIFEKSIHGGLGKGNLGVLASRKGVGKTACLVHIATDQLFRDKHVIHVSFSAKVDHIISWYEDIFKEIAKKRELEAAVDIHDEIIKNRVIMNFNQQSIETSQILKSINAMIRDGHFAADTVIFDGFEIEKAEDGDLELIKEFAKEGGLEVWFSVSLPEEEPLFNEKGIPPKLESFLENIAVLITLRYSGDHVRFEAVKDHDEPEPVDMHLMLDPKTLLVAQET
ncbi:MAG: hypothetical protein HN368_03260 [Spirochaetales bacterium]|jgi:hypothetical protein|nr:hypothetical protein [Spirochaetales bacterium]